MCATCLFSVGFRSPIPEFRGFYTQLKFGADFQWFDFLFWRDLGDPALIFGCNFRLYFVYYKTFSSLVLSH